MNTSPYTGKCGRGTASCRVPPAASGGFGGLYPPADLPDQSGGAAQGEGLVRQGGGERGQVPGDGVEALAGGGAGSGCDPCHAPKHAAG